MAFVKCGHCGEQYKDSLRKCPFCKQETWPERCPDCNTVINAGVNLCPGCGTAIRPELTPQPQAATPSVPTETAVVADERNLLQTLAVVFLAMAILSLAGMVFIDTLTCAVSAITLFVAAYVVRKF